MNTKILFPLAAGALAGAAIAPSKDTLATQGYVEPTLLAGDMAFGVAGLGLGIAGMYYPKVAGAIAGVAGLLLLGAGAMSKISGSGKYVPGVLGLGLAGGMYLGSPSLARGSAQALVGLSSLLAVSSTIDFTNEQRLISAGTVKPAPKTAIPAAAPTPAV